MAQLLLRSAPSSAPLNQYLNWAYASWQPTPGLTLRVGRLALDTGLLVDFSQVGFAYPTVRPNQEMYEPVAHYVDGADLQWRWSGGPADWHLKAQFGGNDEVQPTPGGDVKMGARSAVNVQLTRVQGPLTLRAGGATLRLAGTPLWMRFASLGASWNQGPWQLVAEGALTQMKGASSRRWSGYVGAAYDAGPVTPFVQLGGVHVNAGHSSLSSPALLGQPEQSSRTLGLRWNVHPRADVKLQWDRVQVHAEGGQMWGVPFNAAPRRIDLLSTALDVVF